MKRKRLAEERITGVSKEAGAGAKTGDLARRSGMRRNDLCNGGRQASPQLQTRRRKAKPQPPLIVDVVDKLHIQVWQHFLLEQAQA